jgi:hypothetical protein
MPAAVIILLLMLHPCCLSKHKTSLIATTKRTGSPARGRNCLYNELKNTARYRALMATPGTLAFVTLTDAAGLLKLDPRLYAVIV